MKKPELIEYAKSLGFKLVLDTSASTSVTRPSQPMLVFRFDRHGFIKCNITVNIIGASNNTSITNAFLRGIMAVGAYEQEKLQSQQNIF